MAAFASEAVLGFLIPFAMKKVQLLAIANKNALLYVSRLMKKMWHKKAWQRR